MGNSYCLNLKNKSISNVGWFFCLTLLIIVLSEKNAFSQSTTVNNLTISGFYADHDYTDDDGDNVNDYRFWVWLNGSDDPITKNCFKIFGRPGWHFEVWHNTLPNDQPLFIPNINDLNTSVFTLEAEAWEDDGCDGECSYNRCTFQSDDGHCERSLGHLGNAESLSILEYEPGRNNTIVFDYHPENYDSYALQYEFSYTVPRPTLLLLQSPTQPICDANPTLVFGGTSFISDKFRSRVEFILDYSLDNRNWTTVTNSFNGDPVSFWWIRGLAGLTNITTLKNVFFRLRTRFWASDGGQYISNPSGSILIQLAPLPPTIESFSSAISCPSPNNNGSVKVNVSGLGEYLYSLRPPGTPAPGECIPNPNINGDQCGAPVFRVPENTFTFSNIGANNYTLVVFNKGGTAGVCFSSVPVTVDAIPTLQLQSPDITPVTCHGGSDGVVTLSSTGGITPWTYNLIKSGFSTDPNNTGTFGSLQTGTYVASVIDGCNQSTQATFTSAVVPEPKNILAALNPTSPSCNSPANGSVQVDIIQGEGTYSFSLLKYDNPIHMLNDTTLNRWTVSSLDSGNYTLEIKDAERLQCEGSSSSAKLTVAPAFHIDGNTIATHNVNCFGENNGEIKLNVSSSNDFIYTLSGNDQVTSSLTPTFSSLRAAIYSMTMQRNVNRCDESDTYPLPIEITQPEEIIITIEEHDISCFGEVDGNITAHLQGATGTDHYTWETKIGNSWSTLSNTTTGLKNLIAGAYHFKMSNGNGCTAESDEIAIIEPAKLLIADVTVRDTKCWGELAEIETTLTGGVTPYYYRYASADTIIQSTTAITSFNKGIYSLHVEDVNGCPADYKNNLTITKPDLPLVFIDLLSNHNGYNVSCAGASDATANFFAWGGNGGNYSGYEYGVDGMYQTNENITNISAGTHVLSTRDGRGCIVSRNVVFNEPVNMLIPNLMSQHNVTCVGDINGVISINASGGVNPYTFQLQDKSPQQNGVFSYLAPGSYTITIKDKNGCTTQFTDEILVLTPPIDIVTHVVNVSCAGGHDGAIQIEGKSGLQPFLYNWQEDLGSSSELTNLTAGSYILNVTDQQGCSANFNTTVTEPKPLLLQVTSIPACVGNLTGELRLKPSGGVMPFIYSLDDANYQVNAIFTNVAVGPYTAQVRDANNCKTSVQTAVDATNKPPEPNFIVATKQNAQDTLAIREICVPKPDSLEWTFDTGITVVNKDNWLPEIVIKDAGTYGISLKGYFNGCDYTKHITLNIAPYDPENYKGTTIPLEVIKKITVSPNPNHGVFTIVIDLNTKQYVSLKVFDLLGVTHVSKTLDKAMHLEENIDLTNQAIAQGVYFLQVVTNTDAREIKLVINP